MILWFSVLIFGSITVLEVSAHYGKRTLRSLLLLGDFGLEVMMPRTQEMLVPILPSRLPECYFACGAGKSHLQKQLFSVLAYQWYGLMGFFPSNQRPLVFNSSNDTLRFV